MAGTVTISDVKRIDHIARPVRRYQIDWTSDASGDVNGTKTGRISGILERCVTVPDGTAVPTALYDLTIEDDHGIDVLGGNGADRSDTAAEEINAINRAIDDLLEVKVANAGNAKKGTVYLYVRAG